MMNRGEDPLLRQHRARLLALAETSSGGHYVKPPNNTKRRPNSVKSPVRTGSGKSNHSKITLQDFVRNDPGYTPNIEHLVFPNRKAAAAAAAAAAAPSTQSGHDVTKTRSRLAEMFALSRHLQQRSADRELKNQQQSKKVLNRSIDSSGLPPRELRGGAGHQPSVASVVGAQSSSTSAGSVSTAMGPHSRWAQHLLADESTLSAGTVIPTGGLGGGGGSAPATARVSPNADSDHSGSCVSAAAGMAMASSARGSNVSILHLRSTSEPWDRDPIPSNHLSQPSTSSSAYTSGGSTLPQTGSLSGSHSARSYSSTRASSMTTASSALIRDQIHGNLALTKHQSLGGSNGYGNPRKKESTLYHAPSSQMTSQELFVSGGTCSRELSPVRWCDREVDGVYLGRSGWVQVQQRSLDENRRSNYEMPSACTNIVSTTSTVTIPQTRRTIKLADYHCNSEPSKYPELIHASEPQRPAYLPLRRNECEPSSTTPSPHSIPESYSPPSITPIISPPPAFQDAKSSKTKSRYYYGTKPFLPRSKAIDTDIISPPASPPPPPINWSTLPTTRVPAVSPQIVSQQSQPTRPRPKLTPSPISSHSLQHQYRLPQTKSLEDTTPSRRSQFVQRYIESSSSSSSASLGFRSLDSCVNRSVMPRLAENTDSSVEGYEDGDEEEISSSINLSGVSSIVLNSSPESINGRNGGNREKVSPSGRHSRISHHRTQSRRSPAASDANKQVTCSSPDSSSSCSPPGRSPSGGSHNYRRTGTGVRPHQTARPGQQQIDPNVQRVRRSRSLQLPEKRSPGSGGSGRENYPIRVSPQQAPEPHRVVVKIANSAERPRRHITSQHSGSTTHSFEAEIDDDVLREAEVVTEFLYGSRSRAAAKALLMHRFYDRREEKEPPARAPIDNGYNVFFVSGGNGTKQPPTQQQQRQKVLQRGATTPNMSSPMFSSSPTTEKNPCTSSTCDFWPHCAHRDTLSSQAQAIFSGNMRISQSYPTHQRQANDTAVVQRQDSGSRSTPAALERMQEPEQPEAVSGGSGSGSSGNHRKGRNNGRASSAVSAARRPVGISGNGIDKTLHVERETNRCSEVIIINSERDRLTTRVGPDQRRIVGNTSTGVVVVSKRDKSSDRGAIKTSPVNAKSANVSRSPSAVGNSSSNSSSSSDIWVTTSDRTATKSPRNIKSSGASTPLDETTSFKSDQIREMILTRPGSAPASNTKQDRASNKIDLTESQQRSMSLPKSFMSKSSKQSGQFPWKRQTTESPCSTPSPRHRAVTPETVHTAPVTPSHDLVDRRRSPGAHTRASRRVKASSTPHLLEQNVTAASPQHGSNTWDASSERNWSNKRIGDRCDDLGLVNTPGVSPHHARSSIQSQETPKDQTYQQQQRPISGCTTESVLQKFRKTFSLRFQKKGSKESCSTDYDGPSQGSLEESVEIGSEPAAEEDSPQHAAHETQPAEDTTEQKYRFGPLIWRSSKERKKNNKAARNAKCNSGDSGIQIEMASGCSGGGAGGDSSESHETDSPPAVRRRVTTGERGSRPHSDLINQILIDKFKADLQSRSSRHQHVRRTHSDLGGRRLLQWDTRGGPYRRMLSSPSPIRARPGSRVSPRHAPPAAPGGVVLRPHRTRPGRPQLRRSLSQPLDIDKLSPLMRTKASGLRSHGTHILSEDEHDCRGGTSDDEMISDSESSIASLTERKRSLEMAMDEEVVILAEAVWDHVTMEPEELAFRAGDVIEVLETVDRDWWWGATGGQVGWFPAAFVRLRVSQEDTVEDCLAAMASGQSSSTQLRRRTSISLLSNEQVRTSVVRELVHTERDFVKVLRDVSEGYITECRRRTDMFTEEQIETIFINIEDLLEFQAAFLRDLEACIDWEAPHKSCLGECFLKHKSGFRMYSDYCNSHPMATATLQELYQHNSYSKFFEACRLMRGLIEIPLDGYLLTPVQRICKYPLQLAELLKYTKVDHPDYNKIQEALDAMKGVAVLINERKRRMESLEKLAAWQQRVEGWEGEDLIEISSQLIHQGDAIRVTTGMWTNNITLFLFDHQIVYCKKDIIKRNTYVYKGRICLDTSEIIDVADGKEPQLGVSVRHGIKIYSCVRDKWLLFCCRNANEKECWLSALAEERRLVAKDRLEGLDFPPAARQLARIAARRLRRPPTKPRNGKNYKRDSTYVGSLLQLNSQHNSNSLGRKMGTWFTFGSNKKGRPQHVPS